MFVRVPVICLVPASSGDVHVLACVYGVGEVVFVAP